MVVAVTHGDECGKTFPSQSATTSTTDLALPLTSARFQLAVTITTLRIHCPKALKPDKAVSWVLQ